MAKKGRDFEGEVADWLRRELGYTRTRLNEMVKLDKRQGPWECDVHAERSKFNWERLRTVGVLCLITGLGSAAMQRGDIARPALLIGIIVAALWIIGSKLARSEHVWVECKDLRGPVNRDHIVKLANTVRQSKVSRSASWRADRAFFFSASGYNKDAREIARVEGIECYEQNDRGQFTRIK